jgi:mercuric ion transport protein
MSLARVLTWAGGAGALVGIICCFTPLLPMLLGFVGAGAILHYVYSDAVLLPFAAISLVVMSVGIWIGRKNNG